MRLALPLVLVFGVACASTQASSGDMTERVAPTTAASSADAFRSWPWIGDLRSGRFYPASCAITKRIKEDWRAYYRTAEDAIEHGMRRGHC